MSFADNGERRTASTPLAASCGLRRCSLQRRETSRGDEHRRL